MPPRAEAWRTRHTDGHGWRLLIGLLHLHGIGNASLLTHDGRQTSTLVARPSILGGPGVGWAAGD